MRVEKPQEPCPARLFDFLRKMISTVPSYADELILLVFAAFFELWQSAKKQVIWQTGGLPRKVIRILFGKGKETGRSS